MRLCLTAAFLMLAGAAAAETGRWIIQQDSDAITDKPITVAMLPAEPGYTCFGQQAHLLVRCNDRTLNVFVSHGCYAPGDGGTVGVTLRHGSGTPASATFRTDTTDRAFGLWDSADSRAFLRTMLGQNRLTMRFTPYRQPEHTLEFNTSGLRQALRDSAMQCRVQDLLTAD